eukprot:scaffold34637_cov187-Amphora_coffeaeformis.AAC.2
MPRDGVARVGEPHQVSVSVERETKNVGRKSTPPLRVPREYPKSYCTCTHWDPKSHWLQYW